MSRRRVRAAWTNPRRSVQSALPAAAAHRWRRRRSRGPGHERRSEAFSGASRRRPTNWAAAARARMGVMLVFGAVWSSVLAVVGGAFAPSKRPPFRRWDGRGSRTQDAPHGRVAAQGAVAVADARRASPPSRRSRARLRASRRRAHRADARPNAGRLRPRPAAPLAGPRRAGRAQRRSQAGARRAPPRRAAARRGRNRRSQERRMQGRRGGVHRRTDANPESAEAHGSARARAVQPQPPARGAERRRTRREAQPASWRTRTSSSAACARTTATPKRRGAPTSATWIWIPRGNTPPTCARSSGKLPAKL